MAAILGVVAAAIVFFIVAKWWEEGLINGTEALVLATLYCGMVFGLFVTDGWGRVLVLIPLLGSAGWAINQHRKDGVRYYYRERIKTYEKVIMADPSNISARSSLAEAYYFLGDLDNAIAAMEIAVDVGKSVTKERYRLKQWQEEREIRDSKTVTCQNCHTVNLWGETLCRTCRMPIVYPTSTGVGSSTWFQSNWPCVLVTSGWIIMSGAGFAYLSPLQALVVTVSGGLATCGYALIRSSKKSR